MLLSFFKTHDLKLTRYKLLFIYILNVTDIIFTQLLLGTGHFIEVNVFMRPLVENKAASLLVKVGAVLLLLTIIGWRIGNATEWQLTVANKIINGCLIFYLIINFSHIAWGTVTAILI